ncbi:hypothetical protein [Neorhizobium alkalisoli]|uniref:Uncharacterized protein n=1 Tax=Neorhizobium alkalisoli TaxID=528178 RepID=A0A561QSA3_9HYPH|nr:hypothetical protein [Neorhizobium alkalisoli]TWF53244.1 hypothetical protein FHW37_104521 [Neorhizobium alkalisoli]
MSKPLGGATRTFLRRVSFAGEPLHAEPDELTLADSCLRAGFIRRAPGIGNFSITDVGQAYLDKLARCE